jgi:hypothetical protein
LETLRKTTKRLIPDLFLFLSCISSVLSPAASAQDHVGNVLGGEAKIEVLHRYERPDMLPKPAQVVIQDFTNSGPIITDAEVSHHHHHADSHVTPDELVQQLQDSFAKTLIGQLKKMNLEPERLSDASTVVGSALVIEGEFTSIAPGNSRKRIIVGFGRGASDLKTHVTIYELGNGHRIILLECNIDSQSGKKPGAVMSTSGTGFAAGVATGHFGDKRSSTVQADASRMAKLIIKQTKTIMIAQQWITEPQQK